ncbi:putative proteinD DEPENDENT EPIMERASE/DEHYDRATASE [Salix koriyanagi]|uniref:Uncharacterized protein n=1 Tax=Salix koriyanagi TaxID=2511006 RepID=A0A9Q0T6J2_9ROSI|nr:putative proteinD DEPENDENT EPIMERASE/DEHYDRATASE [Salix koriyanagi]
MLSACLNPVLVIGSLLQPTVNASTIHILKYLTGSVKTYANSVQAYVHVRDVALAHILVFETPSVSGRYICYERMLHHGECSNEKNPRKQSYKLTNQKIKDLVIEFNPVKQESEAMNIKAEFIRSAKELKEAGIKFGKQEESYGLFQGSQHLYVTDFITLMDCLINTREDVQILRHCRIIENGLGDDEMVCMLFNNLGINVMLSDRDRFYYAQVFERVEMHCARRRNVWMAKLRRNYFNSPWSLISFIGALSLLLLTFLQTVFTVMSTFK